MPGIFSMKIVSLSDEKNKPVVLALREIAEEKVIAVKKPSK